MTIFLIIITAAVSLAAFSRPDIARKLAFNPSAANHNNEWWRFFTHAFVHADMGHLAINMFVLYSFGDLVEQVFNRLFQHGEVNYIMLYIGGILFSSLWDYAKQKNNVYYSAVGASGAVAAVVFASILLHPTGKIYFFFIPIGIPSFIFGILYLVYSAHMAKRSQDNIGHNAHFWGAVFGFCFTILLKPTLGFSFIDQIIGYIG